MMDCPPDEPPTDSWHATPLIHPAVIGFLAVMALGSWFQSARPSTRSDLPATDISADGPMLIDINEADRSLLGVLPGIGPTIASRIVEHRERFGRFSHPEGLLEVHGIGPKTFDGFRRHAVVLDPIVGRAGATLAVDGR